MWSVIPLESIIGSSLDKLKAAIVRDRNAGTVVFDMRSIPLDPPPKLPRWLRKLPDDFPIIVDKYVSCFEFARLGERWISISRQQATDLLCQLLSRDMAYQQELMPEPTARDYASQFLQRFSVDCRYVTNGQFTDAVLQHGWTPVQGATFDTGVICSDNDKIGMLWFADED